MNVSSLHFIVLVVSKKFKNWKSLQNSLQPLIYNQIGAENPPFLLLLYILLQIGKKPKKPFWPLSNKVYFYNDCDYEKSSYEKYLPILAREFGLA